MAAAMDPILDARLGVLEHNLDRTVHICEWQRLRADLEFNEYPVDSDAWNAAFGRVRATAYAVSIRIRDLRVDVEDGLDRPSAAWHTYAELQQDARDVCRACIDLLGGFVLRDHMPAGGDRLLDRRICNFTEKLADRCNKVTDPSLKALLAIPAAEDAIAETLTRVIRLRFPEWTVWTLPLVAYEYAHAVFDDVTQLNDAINSEFRRRQKLLPDEHADAARAAVATMMADVYGTYVMGPAYVCAAVLLRLDPIDGGGASGVERAETMFAAVEKIYSENQDPARFVRDNVRTYWDATLEQVAPDADHTAVSERARGFATRALRTVRQTTYSGADFPEEAAIGENWTRAKQLSDAWCTQFSEEETRNAPETYELREVLNAAWRSRFVRPRSVLDFARAARDACDTAIEPAPESGPSEIIEPKRPTIGNGGER